MEKSEQIRLLAKKLIAILVVFCILFAHSAVAGNNIVIAMEEALENQKTITKGENIKFDAFFASDSILHEKELNIKETQSLYLQIAVKDKYSLPNATIKIEDPNFSINKDELKKNKYLGKVNTKTNEIEIKNISSNNTALIELPINFKRQEKMDSNYFDKEIEIKIEGKYSDENQKEKDVAGMVKIKPMWTADEDINIKQSISKYFSLGENGTLIEQEIEAQVAENTLPVKSEVVQTQIPKLHDQKPESIVVLINGERLSDENVRINDQDILRFEYTNTDEDIRWKEDAEENKRTYTIVYKYSDTTELTETPINLKTSVASSLYTLKDNIVKEDSQDLTVTPIGNIVTVDTQLAGNIYKGYLYENEDKSESYIEKNDITISYVEGIENISLKTDNNIYTNEQGMGIIPAENILYKETKLKKEELMNILGEEGKATIKDAEGNIITEITKDTETDEEGIIKVEYGEGQKGISIETSKPQEEGKITVLNKKLINGVTNQSKKVVKLIKQLVATPEVTTNMTKESTAANMELKETTTEAKLEIGTNSLSTMQENEDIEIKATLKSNSQEQDLYLNPSIIIEFPTDVKEVQVNSINKIFGDEFVEVKPTQGIVNGKQAIRIDLVGEQKGHKEAGTEGTVIDINANLKLNERAISKQDVFKMTYTNAKANQYKDGATNGIEEKSIDIVSPKSLITTNNVETLGITTMGEDEGVKQTIPIHAEGKVLKMQSSVTNNNSTEISNVKILGTFGTKGTAKIGENDYENNIDTVLKSPLTVEGIDPSEVRIYYSENEAATDDIEDVNNRWQSEIGNPGSIKKYLIETSKMDVAQEMKIGYDIEVPPDLQYNQGMYQGYSVKYNDNQTNVTQEVKATTIALKTSQGPNVKTKLVAKVGQDELENGGNVKKGEKIEYNLEIHNEGDVDSGNVNIILQVPEGTTLLNTKEDYFGSYEESQEKEVRFEIPQVKAGETINKTIFVKVNQNAQIGSNIKLTGNIESNDVAEKTLESNFVVDDAEGGIDVNFEYFQRNLNLTAGTSANILIKVKNETESIMKNVKVISKIPEGFTIINNVLFGDFTSKNESDTCVIEEIGVGETKIVNLFVQTDVKLKGGYYPLTAVVNYKNEDYRANIANVRVEGNESLNVTTECDKDGENVNIGDFITYTVRMKNKRDREIDGFKVTDILPTYLMLREVTLVDGEGKLTNIPVTDNDFEHLLAFAANEEKVLRLKAEVVSLDKIFEDINLINKILVYENSNVIHESKEFVSILKSTEHTEEPTPGIEPTPTTQPSENPTTQPSENPTTQPSNNPTTQPSENPTTQPSENPGENPTTQPSENPGENPTTQPGENPGDNPTTQPGENPGENPTTQPGGNPGENPTTQPDENPDIQYQEPEKQTTISGYAWVDGDLNGSKDEYENTVENMVVKLLDVETNEFATDEEGNEIQGMTDSTGKYVLENIPAGEYIVVFEYNTAMYKITAYQKSGVDESKNSKAISKALDIDGEEKTYGITDVLTIKEEDNISNINIGLVTTGKFDFSLDKYINSIYVITSDGDVKDYSYDKETLAKVELDRKKMEDADIVIEYYLEVKNIGEVSGYVKTIEDYLPQDLVFSSEMNYDWYQTGSTLRTNSLQDLAIAPGESEVIPLILTKKMTEDNTGIMGNTAEIIEAYNEEGTEDINSIPGNGDKNENDYSSADVIVSVKTGSGVVYTSLALVIVVITGLGVYFIRKKVLNTNRIRRKI